MEIASKFTILRGHPPRPLSNLPGGEELIGDTPGYLPGGRQVIRDTPGYLPGGRQVIGIPFWRSRSDRETFLAVKG